MYHFYRRLNRLEPTRIVRRVFGYSQNIPHYTTGSTPEKFILLDEPNAPPYQLVSYKLDAISNRFDQLSLRMANLCHIYSLSVDIVLYYNKVCLGKYPVILNITRVV